MTEFGTVARSKGGGFWARIADPEMGEIADPRQEWQKIRDARDLIPQVRLDVAHELLFSDGFKMEELKGMEQRIDPVISALDELYPELQRLVQPPEKKAHAAWR